MGQRQNDHGARCQQRVGVGRNQRIGGEAALAGIHFHDAGGHLGGLLRVHTVGLQTQREQMIFGLVQLQQFTDVGHAMFDMAG